MKSRRAALALLISLLVLAALVTRRRLLGPTSREKAAPRVLVAKPKPPPLPSASAPPQVRKPSERVRPPYLDGVARLANVFG